MLKEVDSVALRSAVFDLEDAYKPFFDKRAEYPNYKCKGYKESYRTSNMVSVYKDKEYNSIELDLDEKTIKLPKLKKINIRGYRNLKGINGRIINATIQKEANRYYVSVLVDDKSPIKEIESNYAVGIDLGITNLLTTSQGEVYQTEDYIKKYGKKLKHEQRNLLRKLKGSNNYLKNKYKIQRIHQKIRNSRKYLLHEISKKLTEENKVIAVENLDIKKMIKEKIISKEITNASWGELIRQLEYKSKLKKVRLVKENRYYASSQICNKCGYKNEKLKDLSIREYICPKCNEEHNRDMNAAINIMRKGMKTILRQRLSPNSACGGYRL